jgi:branched-chain amino acid transport system substrate-binding protein
MINAQGGINGRKINFIAYDCFIRTMIVLKACGGELTRENVVKQAANIHELDLPMLLPGITINTSRADFAPIKQVQKGEFNGERWELFGRS